MAYSRNNIHDIINERLAVLERKRPLTRDKLEAGDDGIDSSKPSSSSHVINEEDSPPTSKRRITGTRKKKNIVATAGASAAAAGSAASAHDDERPTMKRSATLLKERQLNWPSAVKDEMFVEMLKLRHDTRLDPATFDKLMAWAKDKNQCENLVHRGIIYLAIDFFKRNIQCPKSALQSVALLNEMVNIRCTYTNTIAAIGGFHLTIEAMGRHMPFPELQLVGCTFIKLTACQVSGQQFPKEVVKWDESMSVLLQVLDTHEANPSVLGQAYFALKSLLSILSSDTLPNALSCKVIKTTFHILNVILESKVPYDVFTQERSLLTRMFEVLRVTMMISESHARDILTGYMTIVKGITASINKTFLRDPVLRSVLIDIGMECLNFVSKTGFEKSKTGFEKDLPRQWIIQVGGITAFGGLIESSETNQEIKTVARRVIYALVQKDLVP